MFKRIKNSNYEISDNGILRNIKTGRELKYQTNHHGYYKVKINIGDGYKCYFIHRLVAMTFLDRIEEKPYINHKNSNKKDNRASNLEWCSVQENNAHAYLNNKNMSKKVPILAINKETGEKTQFDSIYQGAKFLLLENASSKKISKYSDNIRLCCQGRIKSSKGYIWQYL